MRGVRQGVQVRNLQGRGTRLLVMNGLGGWVARSECGEKREDAVVVTKEGERSQATSWLNERRGESCSSTVQTSPKMRPQNEGSAQAFRHVNLTGFAKLNCMQRNKI